MKKINNIKGNWKIPTKKQFNKINLDNLRGNNPYNKVVFS